MKIVTRDFDLNNDGRPDRLTAPISTDDDPVSNEEASFYIKPELSLRDVIAPMRPMVLRGFQRAGDSGYTCGVHFFAIAAPQPAARFYAGNGLASFVVGQRAGALNEKGEMTDIMDIHGIAVKIVRYPPFNGGDLVYTPGHDRPFNPGPHRVQHWAYSVDSKTDEVVRREDTSDLCWVVTNVGKPERLDPNRIARNDSALTDSEKMVKDLFDKARVLYVEKPNDAQKKDIINKLRKTVKNWERKHALSNPLAKEIRNPMLWQGVLGAMAALSGLTPADFPT